MALKAVLENLDGIEDDSIKAEYKQGGDGKYYLDIEGKPRGFEPSADLATANTKLEEFRTNNRTLNRELEEEREKLKRFEGIDPDEHAQLKAKVDGLDKKGIKDPEALEAMMERAVKKATDPLKASIATLEKERDDAKASLGSSEVRSALSKAGAGLVEDSAMDDFLERGAKVFKYRDGRVVALDEEGAPLFNPEKPTEALTPAAWAAGLTDKAPHLFRKNKGGGASGGGGSPSTVRTVSNDPLEFGKNVEDIAAGKATTEAAAAEQ